MSSSPAEVPGEAVEVLRAFLDASLRRDEPAMKACLTRQTLESGQFSQGPEGVRFVVGQGTMEGDNAVIPVQGIPLEAGDDAPPALELACIMVREDGAWKLDLVQTMERMMGGSMEAAMGQVASAMSDAIKGVGDALSEGLRGAFGESSEEGDAQVPPDWDKAPRDYAPEELYALPEMMPLPKTQAAISDAVGSAVIVQVAMADILGRMGVTEHEVMLNWMDDQLFAGYGAIVAAINEYLPLKDRLRAVRIEAADWHDQRMVALDGSDLVFRLHFPDPEGYYGDEWVAWALPGVLCGLPETIDQAVAGHRTLPQKDEAVSHDVFRERTIPRCMRRISGHLGRPIRLDLNWDDVYDREFASRALSWWGLNRVWGGIARAGLDADTKRALSADLHTVRIVLETYRGARAARYADGVLELHIEQHSGEPGAFYEGDIASVLTGQEIKAEMDAAGESEAAEPAEIAAVDAADAARDAENLREAIKSFTDVEPTWRQQAELALGHDVELVLDYDSLGGRYDLLQPFIHQSLSGALGALCAIGFGQDVEARDQLRTAVQRLVVRMPQPDEAGLVDLADGVLTVRPPLADDGQAPINEIAAAILALLGRKPAATPPTDAADETAVAVEPRGDVYEQAGRHMDKLEAVLRDVGVWPGDPPPGPLEVKGAFGSENMAYEQWLAWVLIPRVREIIAERGEFPEGSMSATYGRRALDGMPGGDEVIDVLYGFDQFVNELPR